MPVKPNASSTCGGDSTFTSRPYFFSVANSPSDMVSPPSPTIATTCRSGQASLAAIA